MFQIVAALPPFQLEWQSFHFWLFGVIFVFLYLMHNGLYGSHDKWAVLTDTPVPSHIRIKRIALGILCHGIFLLALIVVFGKAKGGVEGLINDSGWVNSIFSFFLCSMGMCFVTRLY